MLSILIIVFLTSSSFGYKPHHRVINGHDARTNEFPYMVKYNAKGFCAGALISDKFILTCAHCLWDSEGKFTVVLGDNSRNYHSKNTASVKYDGVMNYWIHEKFTALSDVDDVGLIELPSPVKFTDSIKPVKLSKNLNIDSSGNDVKAVLLGWGKISQTNYPKTLQIAELALIAIDDCKKLQQNYDLDITDSHICAKGHDKEGKIIAGCNGDSGL